MKKEKLPGGDAMPGEKEEKGLGLGAGPSASEAGEGQVGGREAGSEGHGEGRAEGREGRAEGKGQRPDFRVVQPSVNKAGQQEFVDVGAMWRNISQQGNIFYTLKIGKLRLLVFPNQK